MDFQRNDRVTTSDGKKGYVSSSWPMNHGDAVVYNVMVDGEWDAVQYYVHELEYPLLH